jgi:hypothetical protein
VGVDLVDHAGLVAVLWQEDLDQVDDLLAGQHTGGTAVCRIELGQPLPQQSQQETHVEAERAPRDQPRGLVQRRLRAALVVRALPEEGVALCLVDDDGESHRRHVVADRRLQLQEVPPWLGVGVRVHHPLHQRGDDQREAELAARNQSRRHGYVSSAARSPTVRT